MSYSASAFRCQPTGQPPLELPYYGISFGGAIARGFKKYATFAGRASRSEYWWWTLFTFSPTSCSGCWHSRGRHGDVTRWRSNSGTPRDTADHCVRRLLPRDHRAYARFDRSATARRWIQRALCALAAHSLSGKPDHNDLRVVAELCRLALSTTRGRICAASQAPLRGRTPHRVRASSR